MVTLTGPEWLIEPTLPDDSPNPFWNDLLYLSVRAVGRDSKIDIDVRDGIAVISGIVDTRKLTVDQVSGLFALGVETNGLEFFVELADTSGQVPAYLPGAEDDEGTARSWADWPDDSHQVAEYGGNYYISTAARGSSPLPGSVVAQLAAEPLTLKTTQEMRDIIAANPPAE